MQRARRRISLPLVVAVASAILAAWSAVAAQSAASTADEQLRFQRTVMTKGVVMDAIADLDVAGLKSSAVLESVESVAEDPSIDPAFLMDELEELEKYLDVFLVSSNKAAVYVLGNLQVSASLADLQTTAMSSQEKTRQLVVALGAGDDGVEALETEAREKWSELKEVAYVTRKIVACQYVTDPAWDAGEWRQKCGALPSL